MDFLTFCRAQGIIIDYLPPLGEWKRYPTTDKPKHRNGAVRYMGNFGVSQNHATATEVSIWRPDSDDLPKMDMAAIKRAQFAAAKLAQDAQVAAAKKAGFILHQCRLETHQYLRDKGFPDERMNVYKDEEGVLRLCVPMRVCGRLVGLQQIYADDEGNYVKKFLYGQRSQDAEFVMDNGGTHVLCEGLATAMSARKVIQSLKFKYTLHVCFSAQNMLRVSKNLKTGIVIADNDKSGTGERIAKEIGWPYWMSDVEGEDCNDALQRMGLFKLGQSIRPHLALALRRNG